MEIAIVMTTTVLPEEADKEVLIVTAVMQTALETWGQPEHPIEAGKSPFNSVADDGAVTPKVRVRVSAKVEI